MSKKTIFLILFVFILPFFGGQTEADASGYIRPAKIVMVWDYIENMEDNDKLLNNHAYETADVISPTWFSLKDTNGGILSLADAEYVRRAHDNGVKVWALFDNAFDDRLTYQVLSNRNTRAKVIGRIVSYSQEYELDGINIDFEAMSRETGVYFESFIIELYKELKPLGVCLSVDIPLPVGDVQQIYDISRVASNSDYIVVMAYDQHHEKSGTAGPVASIEWVRQGVADIMQYTTSGKIILGVPFYTRIWIEDKETGIMTSESDGMRAAYNRFRKNADTLYRERATAQVYAEYSAEGKRYKVWLEDDHSLSLKLDAVNDYSLAGVSAWRLGLEWPKTWELIDAYFE